MSNVKFLKKSKIIYYIKNNSRFPVSEFENDTESYKRDFKSFNEKLSPYSFIIIRQVQHMQGGDLSLF